MKPPREKKRKERAVPFPFSTLADLPDPITDSPPCQPRLRGFGRNDWPAYPTFFPLPVVWRRGHGVSVTIGKSNRRSGGGPIRPSKTIGTSKAHQRPNQHKPWLGRQQPPTRKRQGRSFAANPHDRGELRGRELLGREASLRRTRRQPRKRLSRFEDKVGGQVRRTRSNIKP